VVIGTSTGAALGLPLGAPIRTPRAVLAISALRRRDGSSPCGRSAIMITSAAPKTRIRYSAKPRKRSRQPGDQEGTDHESGMLPAPPSSTAARDGGGQDEREFVGRLKKDWKTTPARHADQAPIANASSLNLKVGHHAASDPDAQARPTRLRPGASENTIASTIMASTR